MTPAQKLKRIGVSACSKMQNAFPSKKTFSYQANLLFIGGVGHSGTTLLAAKLGNHDKVYLTPREHKLFDPRINDYYRRMFVRELDRVCCEKGCIALIEKTPKNVQGRRVLKRNFPHAKAIITTRNPLDNIASLYARFRNLDGAIYRYKVDNKEALKFKNEEFSLIFPYELFTTNPAEWFTRACNAIGVDFEPQILASGKTGYDHLIANQQEILKSRQAQVQGLINPRIGVYKEILSAGEVAYVLKKTERIAGALGYHGDNFMKHASQ